MKIVHDSDCATHNALAYEPGHCDCGFNERKMKALEEAATPLMEWLSHNYDPHAFALVNSTTATIASGEMSYLTRNFIHD